MEGIDLKLILRTFSNLEGRAEDNHSISQGSRSPDQDLNQGRPKYSLNVYPLSQLGSHTSLTVRCKHTLSQTSSKSTLPFVVSMSCLTMTSNSVGCTVDLKQSILIQLVEVFG